VIDALGKSRQGDVVIAYSNLLRLFLPLLRPSSQEESVRGRSFLLVANTAFLSLLLLWEGIATKLCRTRRRPTNFDSSLLTLTEHSPREVREDGQNSRPQLLSVPRCGSLAPRRAFLAARLDSDEPRLERATRHKFVAGEYLSSG
jgi:hypothetical protein